jgi:hypothetical protein
MGLGSCSLFAPETRNESFIENGTDRPIIVYVIQPDGEERFIELPPGEAGGAGSGGCNDFALIARTGDGREVDRLPAGDLCVSETWVVGGD